MAVALATIVTSALTGSVSAVADGHSGGSIDSGHWGVIARNTIGSPSPISGTARTARTV